MYFKSLRLQLIFVITTLVIVMSCGRNKQAQQEVSKPAVAENISAKQISAQIEKDPSDPELYYQRSVIYGQEKYLDRALADITKAISLDERNPLFYYQKGRMEYAMNRTAEAEKSYLSAITIKSDYEEAKMRLSELYYIVKEHRKSIDMLNTVIAANPAKSDAYFIKGMNLKETGDTAKAIAAFQRAIETDEKNYDAAMQLGILFTEKRSKSAYEYLSAAIRIDRRNPEAYFARAVYLQKTGQFQKALFDYRRVIELEPGNDLAYYNVGYINYEVKQYDEALRSWNLCIQINNSNADAYYMRGLVQELKGNKEEAKLNYEKVLELNPDYTLAAQRLKKSK